MRNVTRTQYGIRLQTARELGVEYDQLPNSSLNEVVRTFPGYAPDGEQPIRADGNQGNFIPSTDTDDMKMRYLAIGRGALAQKTASDGEAIYAPVPHATIDAGFYKLMPFAMFPEGEDMSVSERANYRLRRKVTVGSDTYTAYFLRVLNYDNVEVKTQRYQLVNGDKTDPQDYSPLPAQMNPPRPSLPTGNTMPNDGTYYSSSAPVEIVFTEVEIQRIIAAAEIIAGYPEAARISEYGFVSGCDRQVYWADDVGQTEFTDVIGAQVNSFLVADDSLIGQTQLTKSVNLGNAEPTYGISNITP